MRQRQTTLTNTLTLTQHKAHIMKTFSLKKLSHAIALTTAATLPVHANHVEKRIGDLEIYEAATGGGASVLLMLDSS